MNIALTPRARRDLARISASIARDSPQAARHMAASLLAACERLTLFPFRGRSGLKAGTRELTTVFPYVIVYRVRDQTIEILSIWHGRQDR